MTAGAWVLIVAVLAALAFGLYRAATDGRFRGTHRLATPVEDRASVSASVEERAPASVSKPAAPEDSATPTPTLVDLAAGTGLDLELGERATLLQFSSAFCAPCRATRRTLADVAAVVPGVRHVEVDAEHHLELVRAVGVLRTPTTLVLDARGAEVTRAAGAPRKEQVLDALARA
jgi:thiol-disulfide isomerase/thioredoxin